MNVLLVNGGPHKRGVTNRALEEVAKELNSQGIDTEIYWLGTAPIGGCMACGGCSRTGQCVLDDQVNDFHAKALKADGFVFGAPVHYAHAAGNLLAFMDRLFSSNGRAGTENAFCFKPAAAVASARRGGTTAALDDIQKFFTISQMPIVSSRYWNNIHGNTAEEAERDLEGLWTMRQLGRNMAWMLHSLEAARNAGIALPEQEAGTPTNFIRANELS